MIPCLTRLENGYTSIELPRCTQASDRLGHTIDTDANRWIFENLPHLHMAADVEEINEPSRLLDVVPATLVDVQAIPRLLKQSCRKAAPTTVDSSSSVV